MPLTPTPSGRARRRLAVAGFAALLAGLFAVLGSAPSRSAAAGPARPNVIVVMTDDQRADDPRVMKATRRRVGGAGVTFRKSFATYPLCCPSRVTFLTGQYAHNHGVLNNGGPQGGFDNFVDSPTIATQLRGAGYRTGYLGKYLSGYPKVAREDPAAALPSGWSRWFGLIDSGMYDWSLNANGHIRTFGREVRDYQTDVLARLAKDFVRNHSGPRPFFLVVGTNAPHGEKGRRFASRNPRPAKRHQGTFESVRLPKTPSFNEDDVSDKPPFLQVEKLTREEQKELRDRLRGRLESLLSVDELVAGVVRELRRSDELRRTYVIVTSDNGFMLGEHRLERKRLLYEESARVPLLMRGPGLPKGIKRHQLVGNIDLAPTIYDAADVPPPPSRRPDGISLFDLVADPDEYANRDLLLENQFLGSRDGVGRAVRTPDAVLIEQRVDGTPHRELYDLDPESAVPDPGGYDPFQLVNQYENPLYAGLRARLESRLDELRDCEGNGCR